MDRKIERRVEKNRLPGATDTLTPLASPYPGRVCSGPAGQCMDGCGMLAETIRAIMEVRDDGDLPLIGWRRFVLCID